MISVDPGMLVHMKNFDAAPFYRRPYQFLHHWNLRIPGSHDHASLAALLDRSGNNQNAFCAAAAPRALRESHRSLSTFHAKTFQRLGQCHVKLYVRLWLRSRSTLFGPLT